MKKTALAKVPYDFQLQCGIDNQLLLHLDLPEAFDTVDHDILLKRFAHDLGVKGSVKNVVCCCCNHLKNGTMQVFIDGAYSPTFIMQYGLPQGYAGIHHSKYWMSIHYDIIEDGQNKTSHLFILCL